MRLNHLHLPKPVPYSYARRLQNVFYAEYERYRIAKKESSSLNLQEPSPTLFTFQTEPTYTVGRRRYAAYEVSEAQIKYLTTDLSEVDYAPNRPPLAAWHTSNRGGLITYHGPGQLTAYLVLNIRRHGLGARKYVELLEQTVMKTCQEHGVPNVTKTADTGVWVTERAKEGHTGIEKVTDRKICAIGVRLTGAATQDGLALNVFDKPIDLPKTQSSLYTLPRNNIYLNGSQDGTTDDTGQGTVVPAPGYLTWGFGRIVACGLEGKRATWLAAERDRNGTQNQQASDELLGTVAETMASNFADALKDVDGIDKLEEDEVLSRNSMSWNEMRRLNGQVTDQRPSDFASVWSNRNIREDSGFRIT